MITNLLQQLKRVSELKTIPENQLQWLAEKGEVKPVVLYSHYILTCFFWLPSFSVDYFH